MRMIVIRQATDLQALKARLLAADAANGDSTVQTLKQLNPHVDFSKLAAGTVLLVPEQPGLKASESDSISGEAFDSFEAQVLAAAEATAARVKAGHEALAADRADVAAVLKTAALKRLLEADPDLKKQLDQAAAVYKQDQAAQKESLAQMGTLQEQLKAELAQVGKLLQ